MRTIAIIDAQGAGIGQTIIKKIKKECNCKEVRVVALGTNGVAASNMVKAGAEKSIVGSNNICDFLNKENIWAVIGPIGVICSGGINGEVTADIAREVFKLDCLKYILPLKVHGIYIPGTVNMDIKDMINEIIENISKNL
ncbi:MULTISPECIES: DUF3842 family protein [Clostridium]|uniref:DUF3842 domain-containing protein n=1 Tax=Clostridium cadaveris TaxID=1529 RepID=A0A1I2JNG4_9CLOT|nr:DUF3842 family protein [Clostridium cadaveris]MDU4953370.1 DUF3842 family protein [Clostridium sp.]MDM8311011.1 DUF3842 family protein [Clostridium cadaveris]MDY4949065.1 DUF3842 family protein [Clostridium cadaveris]NME65458.1 DUF3842 family protein [Clostridium cadaveris]NWK10568.1 DUF3842 family protein [Clostridium cadaveris]